MKRKRKAISQREAHRLRKRVAYLEGIINGDPVITKKPVVHWVARDNNALEELRKMAICANAGGLHLTIEASTGGSLSSASVIIYAVEIKMPSAR